MDAKMMRVLESAHGVISPIVRLKQELNRQFNEYVDLYLNTIYNR
jgi:hypothetical protein